MKKFGTQVVLCALLFFAANSFAQSVVPPNAVDVLLEVVEDQTDETEEETPVDLETLFAAAAEGEFSATVVVTLETPDEIAELLVSFSNVDGDVLFEQEIEFDGPAIMEGDISYERDGNVVYLGIGDYATIGSEYQATVAIRDIYGEESVATIYSSNN